MIVGKDRARQILDAAKGKHVAVVGDFMLDRHLFGSVRRISPEAPVPVVEIESERMALGGAGNVVQNLSSLGVKPIGIGLIGGDAAGQDLVRLLDAAGCGLIGMVTSKSRRTTEKTRIIAHDQHVVRADRESTSALNEDEEARLLGAMETVINSLDAVICQDYNKGVLTPRVIGAIRAMCHSKSVPIAVDPKFENFFEYRDCTLFKPNIRELEAALGTRVREDEELSQAAARVFERLSPERVLITRGEKGMSLFLRNGTVEHIATRAKRVHDVSGAGDTVIATYVAAECGGAKAREAAELSNQAAGIVCGDVGVVPIRREQLLDARESE